MPILHFGVVGPEEFTAEELGRVGYELAASAVELDQFFKRLHVHEP